jgi:hypothetical protein
MLVPMFRRAFREEDLSACLAISPRHGGAELGGKDLALNAWGTLIRCSFRAAVVEANPPIVGNRIVGFGSSVFVTRAFADQECSNPYAKPVLGFQYSEQQLPSAPLTGLTDEEPARSLEEPRPFDRKEKRSARSPIRRRTLV